MGRSIKEILMERDGLTEQEWDKGDRKIKDKILKLLREHELLDGQVDLSFEGLQMVMLNSFETLFGQIHKLEEDLDKAAYKIKQLNK